MRDVADITEEKYINHLKNERNLTFSKKTLGSYRSLYGIVFSWFFENEKSFEREHIIEFIAYLKNERRASAGTVNKYLIILAHFADILDKKEELKKIKKQRESAPLYDVLSAKEQEILISTHPPCHVFDMFPEYVRKKMIEKRNKRLDIILEVFIKCGFRFGELRSLKWENWYRIRDNNFGGYFKIFSTKTGRPRLVSVLEDLAIKIDSLSKYSHGYIFGSDRGIADNRSINKEVRERLKFAGLRSEVNTIRRLRVTCGTTMLRSKVPINIVAKKLGNSIKVCYERYDKSNLDDQVEAEYKHPLNVSQAKFLHVKEWAQDFVKKVGSTPFKVVQSDIADKLIHIVVADTT